jgi:hypothetical protein
MLNYTITGIRVRNTDLSAYGILPKTGWNPAYEKGVGALIFSRKTRPLTLRLLYEVLGRWYVQGTLYLSKIICTGYPVHITSDMYRVPCTYPILTGTDMYMVPFTYPKLYVQGTLYLSKIICTGYPVPIQNYMYRLPCAYHIGYVQGALYISDPHWNGYVQGTLYLSKIICTWYSVYIPSTLE